MNEFKIEYVVTLEDYNEANTMLFKKSPHPFRWDEPLLLGAAGLLLIFLVVYETTVGHWNYLVVALTLPFVAFLIYYALQFQFPSLTARRVYHHTSLPGRSFTAEFSPALIKVAGKHLEWVTEWEGFQLVAESPRLFLFYDGFALFVFAKRHFAPDQVAELQKLIMECWKQSGEGGS